MGFAQLGITDGKYTEVIKSKILKDGMEVITGAETQINSEPQNTNIFSPGGNTSRGMRRGF